MDEPNETSHDTNFSQTLCHVKLKNPVCNRIEFLQKIRMFGHWRKSVIQHFKIKALFILYFFIDSYIVYLITLRHFVLVVLPNNWFSQKTTENDFEWEKGKCLLLSLLNCPVVKSQIIKNLKKKKTCFLRGILTKAKWK